VVLTGAPGTAKTTIANAVAHVAEEAGLCSGTLFTTATTDWTALDTVGGYLPSPSGSGLFFQPGKFLQCLQSPEGLKDDRWLVIDELNRADVDKSFGQFFTVLSGHRCELPYRADNRNILILPESEELASGEAEKFRVYRVPSRWRILGTLNTADKASLYEMSFAFLRRFAFVYIPLPDEHGIDELCNRVLRDKHGLEPTVVRALRAMWMRLTRIRPLGPAILLDIGRYVALRKEAADGVVAEGHQVIAEALALYVIPQLEGITAEAFAGLKQELVEWWSEELNEAAVAFLPGL
jgi:MoxR-like ATPase